MNDILLAAFVRSTQTFTEHALEAGKNITGRRVGE
jgi:hypothetical protein